MSSPKANKVKQFEYKAEMKQLLDIIIHSLYTHPEVFLRELISNASDALNKVRFLRLSDSENIEQETELAIRIRIDKETQTFSIEDTGIGMAMDDLTGKLGTVASSGTLDFLKNIKKNDKNFDGQLIGQFGVGFYSVFMVADEITVETKHVDKDAKGYIWKSAGENTFIIEETDRASHGTKITFKLKDEHKDFAEEYRVKSVVKKYSNFVDYPLYVGDETINQVSALWHRNKDAIKEDELNEFYKFVSNDYQEPLGHIHLSIEGNVNFKAMIFIPQTAPPNLFSETHEKNIHLYSSKVFIQDDAKNLIPDYLRFLKGVVDTEDLPLNVSREVTQSSPFMAKINKVITGKIIALLEDWAVNDMAKFDTFYSQFGSIFKTGINTDFANRDRIIDLLRFESTATKSKKTTSFAEYVGRMRDDQNEIYYLSGPTREQIERNPNLEYFRKKGIEVLLLTDAVDIFTIPYLNEYKGKALKSIDKADIDLKGEESKDALGEESSRALLDTFKKVLGDKVEDVIASRRLIDSPATLVVGKQGMDVQLEKMMQMMDKDFESSKKILEINTSHQLIRNLSKLNTSDPDSAKLSDAVNQLFEGTMLLEGYLKSPNDFVSRMTNFMVDATSQ